MSQRNAYYLFHQNPPLGSALSGTIPRTRTVEYTLQSICPENVMNLPAEQGRVSKNLPEARERSPRAEGQVFTDPPEFCWQVHHSCSSKRMLEQFPVVAAAVAT